jgi:hypothetical protein
MALQHREAKPRPILGGLIAPLSCGHPRAPPEGVQLRVDIAVLSGMLACRHEKYKA